MKNIRNIIIAAFAIITAASFTACGNTADSDVDTPVETSIYLYNKEEASSKDDHSPAEVVAEVNSKTDTSTGSDDSKSDDSDPKETTATTKKDDSNTTTKTTAATTKQEVKKKKEETTTTKAVTSAPVQTAAPVVTTTAAPQTTQAPVQTTAKQETKASAKETTKKTTKASEQAPVSTPSTKNYSKLDQAYIHLMQSNVTDAELEMIRKDVCDYALKKWIGKTKVSYTYNNKTTTITFTHPLNIVRNTKLMTEFCDDLMITWGGGHMDVQADCSSRDIDDKSIKDVKNLCKWVMDEGLTEYYLWAYDIDYSNLASTTNYNVDNICESAEYPLAINAGFTWNQSDYYGGQYHTVYAIWFLDGEVDEDTKDTRFELYPEYLDKVIYG